MGVVWAARHTVTRRAVAMKFLSGPRHLQPALRRRFMREARAACAVDHPNVIEVLDVFELDADTPVMVMDLLVGETLKERLAREESLTLEEAATILLPTISAVGTAHARGIVHRDLKPENIFLAKGSDGEQVKVLDFGIAKLIDPAAPGESRLITETGSTLGTPCYMAPEQATGAKDIDYGVDIWALGVILYECLAGFRPIEGESIGQVVAALMKTAVTPLERIRDDLPDDVTALVGRMLQRSRDKRPEDLREVWAALGRYSSIKTPDFGPPGSAPAALGPVDEDVEEMDVTSGIDAHANTVATVAEPSAQASSKTRHLAMAGAFVAVMAAALILFGRSRTAVDATRAPAASESRRTLPVVSSRPVAVASADPAHEDAGIKPSPPPAPPAQSTSKPPVRSRVRRSARARPRASASTAAATSASAPIPVPVFSGGLANTPPF